MTHFRVKGLDLGIDARGYIKTLKVIPKGLDAAAPSERGKPQKPREVTILPTGQEAPLLSLLVDGKVLRPESARWHPSSHVLDLTFRGHQASVKISAKETHLTLELLAESPSKGGDAVIWGPYPTTLAQQIGETIGVVQGQDIAFGLQILNPKTLGGYPNTDDDVEPSYSIFDTDDVVDLKASDADKELYRGDTAKAMNFGSVVQAYTRDRSTDRVIANWAHPFYVAPAYKDKGLVGSKIALFGSSSADALATIGKIEVDEGLPHPMIDGVWGKMSPTAHESYLVMGFDTKNLDECLAIAKEAGLNYLYSDSCFSTWGHFKLNPDGFPKNWDSMKECVERAKAQGIRLGVHTLSNFITPNDSYVTPVPDKRLAEVGSSSLVGAVSPSQTDIVIEDPKFFNEMANNTLRTVRIGDELIQYTSVSALSPWTLNKCKRGAFGTTATAHAARDRIAKLMDHGYGTFLTNADLTKEVAKNIGQFFNKTGVQQLSMDGLEGNWSTGMGQYGRALFAQSWYESLSPALKGQVINDASNPGAYNWHINTRENWGEPWYAGFRQSQTQYRLKNQHYFKRNLMPGMLGWFQLTPETTLEDIQWLLARAAGFDAGFCITASLDSVRKNPQAHEILAAVKTWEDARRAHAFPPSIKRELQNIAAEFRLERLSSREWKLSTVSSFKFPLNGASATMTILVPRGTTPSRVFVDVLKPMQLKNVAFTLDQQRFDPHWPTSVPGKKRLEIDVSHLSSGAHYLQVRLLDFPSKVSSVKELQQPAGLNFEIEVAGPVAYRLHKGETDEDLGKEITRLTLLSR